MLGAGVSVSVSYVDFFPSSAVRRVSGSLDKGQQHQQLLNFIRDGAFEFYAIELGLGGGGWDIFSLRSCWQD